MAKMTRVTLQFFLPTVSFSRVGDAFAAITTEIEKHKGTGIEFGTFAPANFNADGEHDDGRELGRSRAGRNADEGNEGAEGSGSGKSAGGNAGDGDADDKPKRGRGRPRKSDDGAEEARPAGGDGNGGKRAEAGKNDRGNVAPGTDEGADEGDGDGAEGRGSARGRGDAVRGDRQAPRISSGEDRGEAEDDGWGDKPAAKAKGKNAADDWSEDDPKLVAARAPNPKNWPDEFLPCKPEEVDKPVITALLGDHYTAAGGKDRQITFDIMEKATGTRSLAEVDEDDYLKLARALCWDIARYDLGIAK